MVERRLAAILAADVVGYSRLMGADEEATLTSLNDLRSTLFDPTIARHHGRIVKLMGDGALVEFASVVDAVRCGWEVQQALAKRNADLPEVQRLTLRIGINLGDVMIDGEDIYGDGVNIAARLEALAEPGGICVSQAVADQARGKVALGFGDMGEQNLKNIDLPVRVYRLTSEPVSAPAPAPVRERLPTNIAALVLLAALALGGWYMLRPSPVVAISADEVLTIRGPAIAALPFENLGDDPEGDLFARGMTDQVAAALTRFKGVRVLSPRAAAQYADDMAALKQVLGANYLLEGSLRGNEKDVHITASLINVETGAQVWADSFRIEVRPETIVAVQNRLAGQIAGAIASDGLGAVVLDRVADQPAGAPDDPSSFHCTIAADAWQSENDIRAAYACLKGALDQDPSYVVGWATLTEILGNSLVAGIQLSDGPDYDTRAEMLDAARNAVRLAPHSADAHYALAVASFYNGDLDLFLKETEQVLRLNPNDANTISDLGMRMAFSGHWEEGSALVEKALSFNPSVFDPSGFYALAKNHFLRGEYEESLADFKQAWNDAPGWWLNDLNAAYLYADWGKLAEAEDAAAALLEKRPDFVIEDAVEFYRLWQFEQSFIDRMVAALEKAGLPHGNAS